jgi:hypothetical protein
MKKILVSFVLFMSLFGFMALNVDQADASTHVRGYTTKRGTYVQSYYRSNSNSVKYDNYSSKGNYNPYTGKKGYKNW